MNTGADDDSRSTPTFAFSAVWAPALLIVMAALRTNMTTLRMAGAITLMNLPFRWRVVPHPRTKIAVIPGRSEATSPESITTNGGYGFRARAEDGAPRNDDGGVYSPPGTS